MVGQGCSSTSFVHECESGYFVCGRVVRASGSGCGSQMVEHTRHLQSGPEFDSGQSGPESDPDFQLKVPKNVSSGSSRFLVVPSTSMLSPPRSVAVWTGTNEFCE